MYKLAGDGTVIRLEDGANIPRDPQNQDYVAFVAWENAGNAAYPADAPSQEQIVSDFSALISNRLNAFAATRRYDSVDSMSKYKDLTDAEIETLPASRRPIVYRYRDEVRYLLLKTAETWAAAELIEARVLAGNWPSTGAAQVPTSIEQIEAELPALVWPA